LRRAAGSNRLPRGRPTSGARRGYGGEFLAFLGKNRLTDRGENARNQLKHGRPTDVRLGAKGRLTNATYMLHWVFLLSGRCAPGPGSSFVVPAGCFFAVEEGGDGVENACGQR